MKVKFTKDTKHDFKRHREYLINQGKSDGHGYHGGKFFVCKL